MAWRLYDIRRSGGGLRGVRPAVAVCCVVDGGARLELLRVIPSSAVYSGLRSGVVVDLVIAVGGCVSGKPDSSFSCMTDKQRQ